MKIGLGESAISFIISVIRILFRPLLKIALFTGVYWGVIYFLYPNGATEAISGSLMVLTLIQNFIRLKSPNFRIWGIFKKSEKDKEAEIKAPKAENELVAGKLEGFIFGRQEKNFIRKAITMDGHILTIGGAGSGKSSCIAIPSLWAWNSPAFVVDIKGELYDKTKQKRPKIKVFNPMDEGSKGYGYNPYYLLDNSKNPAQDAREIVLAIVPRPADVKEPFWVESAQNLFTGAILDCHSFGLTFLETITLIQSTPIHELIGNIHNSKVQAARYYVNQFIGMDARTLAGIYSELANKITMFVTDPDIIACLTKRQYITPKDIENGYDVFLNIPEDKIEQWKGMLTLITNQFLKHFERRPDNDSTPVLFLLDEFARLGKVETVINGLATLRSKKVTICILTQSLAQLDVIYGKEQRQVIADNCHYKAILSATDADTQDYFSRLVGTYDRTRYNRGSSSESYSGLGKGNSLSEVVEEKRIIKPETFSTLRDIIILSPFGFCRVGKMPYYKTEFWPVSNTSARRIRRNSV